MGQQIIKQPNGKYSVFSSISDTFMIVDWTKEQIIEWRGEEAKQQAEEATKKTIEELDSGKHPYCQFAKTWTEAAATHQRNKGNVRNKDFQKNVEALIKLFR